MPTRTLAVALWNYRDHDGRKRRAHYRETFELPDAEAVRGDRAGVFATEVISTPVAHDPPPRTSAKPVLVDWLTEHRGADPAAIKGLTKPELWQLIEQPESTVAQQYSH